MGRSGIDSGLRIAVTGAAGRIGGQVLELLSAQTAHPVVALTRRRLPSLSRRGRVLNRLADYSDPAALHTALRGVDTLVFVSSDGPVAHVVVHHHNVIRAAADAGVRRIVALSGLDASLDSPFCYAVGYAYTERLLQDSRCEVSIARASIYTEFFSTFLTAARAHGELRLPAANGRISLVSRSDVARSLAALATASPTGRHHDITGPESLDLTTLATLAEHEWRTPIKYVETTPAEYRLELTRAGENPWWTYAYSTMFDSVREQRWASVSGEVKQLTAHSPIPVADVLAQHAAS